MNANRMFLFLSNDNNDDDDQKMGEKDFDCLFV